MGDIGFGEGNINVPLDDNEEQQEQQAAQTAGEEEFGDTGAWKRFGTALFIAKDDGPMVPMVNDQEVTPAKWDWRIVAAWFLFVIYGVVLELFTLLDGNATTPPLTWVVLRYVPETVAIGFISWLLYHFATEYWKKELGDD